MLIGDMGKFTPEEKNVETALIKGLKSVPGQQSITIYVQNPGEVQTALISPILADQMTLNGVYTWGTVPIATLGRHGIFPQPVLPAFLLEEPYDEEGPDGNKV